MSPETLTHAITQHQPLAWALASGHCPVICSDVRPALEHEGMLLGIHAAKYGDVGANYFRVINRLPESFAIPEDRPLGALVGVARLVGVIRTRRWVPPGHLHELRLDLMRGRCATEPIDDATCARIVPWWRPGARWGLFLSDAVLLPEPIPMKGAGGVWRIPATDSGRGLRLAHEWALEQWRKARVGK